MHACVECVNILPTRLGKFVVVRTLGEMACVVYDDMCKVSGPKSISIARILVTQFWHVPQDADQAFIMGYAIQKAAAHIFGTFFGSL